MKTTKILLFFVLTVLTFSCKTTDAVQEKSTFNTPHFELLNETENLSHAESVAYSSDSNLLYVSVQGEQEPGDGSIATLNLDGSLNDIAFAPGLNNPKGIAISGDRLYVSDATQLVEIDLGNGNVLNRYSAGDEKFLNDVAIDATGNVYVSDMGSSSIYRLSTNGIYEKWLTSPELENPNGLLVVDNILYVASWGLPESANAEGFTQGRFLKVDMSSKKISQITQLPQGNLDGLQVFDDQHFLISEWRKGLIYKISKSGEVELFFTSEFSVGDILYLKDKKLLALPLNRQNKVQLYQLTY